MRDELIALLKAGNKRRVYLMVGGGSASTLSIVFGRSKYADPEEVIVYHDDRNDCMSPEDAADAFLKAYGLNKPDID